MNSNIQALIQKIAESEELQAQFEKLETSEAAYELASKLQEGFTKEEFLEAVKGFEAIFNGDITDEELATVAGGTDVPAGPDDRNETAVTVLTPDRPGITPNVSNGFTTMTQTFQDPVTCKGAVYGEKDSVQKVTEASSKTAAI